MRWSPFVNRTTRLIVLVIACGLWTAPLVAQGVAQTAAQSQARRVSLDEALSLFAENNLDLRVARLEALEFRGLARQAGAFPNPTLNVTHEPLSGGTADYSESYVTLSQMVELPGLRNARADGAQWAVRATEARLAADSSRLAFEVKRTYVDAVLADDLLGVARRVTDVFREAARTAATREAQGDISRYDLQRIFVERSRYENLLADAEIRAASARRNLALLILPESDVAEVTVAGLDGETPPTSVGDVIAEQVASGRQEVDAARAAAEAAAADVRLKRSERVPSLTATGGFKRQSDGMNGAFLGVAIPLPLFNRNAGALAGAEARAESGEARLALTKRQVENDIRRAVESYESARRRSDLLTGDELDASSDLLEMAQVAYDLGEMGLLELLDAADALKGARNAQAQLRADLWIAYYNLERATGGFALGSETDLETR
jgi:outer membrane protein, heavy metal efflux system